MLGTCLLICMAMFLLKICSCYIFFLVNAFQILNALERGFSIDDFLCDNHHCHVFLFFFIMIMPCANIDIRF